MKYFLLVLSIVLIASACKKTSTVTGTSTWTRGTKSFTPSKARWVDSMFAAYDTLSLLGLQFARRPTTTGSYYATIEARDGDDYVGRELVQVTISSGKTTIDVGGVWLKRTPMYSDSAWLTAHIVEQ
jgi:hypothetical protein